MDPDESSHGRNPVDEANSHGDSDLIEYSRFLNGEALDPFTFRHLRPTVQPGGQQTQLLGRNLPASDGIEQTVEQRWQDVYVGPFGRRRTA